jgi:hypothetical protein
MTLRARSMRTALCTALVAAAALAIGTPSAQAGVLVRTAVSCDSYQFELPFVPWGDPASYVLAPNGGVERRASGWTLTGEAEPVSGNESYYVHRRTDSKSLSLPAGSSATTRAMCAGIFHPTLRFFARNRGEATSTLQVEVLFEDAKGKVQSLQIGLVTASIRWEPTLPLPVVANLLPLLPGDHTAIAFRFSPLDDTGDWRIDDVYLDPYRRG